MSGAGVGCRPHDGPANLCARIDGIGGGGAVCADGDVLGCQAGACRQGLVTLAVAQGECVAEVAGHGIELRGQGGQGHSVAAVDAELRPLGPCSGGAHERAVDLHAASRCRQRQLAGVALACGRHVDARLRIDRDVALARADAQAHQRREDISREADFYGSMDGASKFVKGDAIAAIEGGGSAMASNLPGGGAAVTVKAGVYENTTDPDEPLYCTSATPIPPERCATSRH